MPVQSGDMTQKSISLYPVVIREARYGGVYEGGKWIAFPECDEFTETMLNYFEGDDCEAVDLFTDEYKQTVGIGETPNHAYADLCNKKGIPQK
jgi:hypothetical protein